MTNKKNFESFDGKIISYREWICENPVGVLQISHGMAESSDRYDAFAEYMTTRGFTVIADDHRGHGDTDPDRRGYCEGDMFNDTLKDLATLNGLYREKHPDLPIILFGHSYGSFLTQAYIERFGSTIDAAILGGSAYFNGAAVTAGKFVAGLNCFLGRGSKPAKFIKKLSFDAYNGKYDDGTTFISQIKEECDVYASAWDCNFTLSYAFYKSFFTNLPKLYKPTETALIPKDLPLLVISGDGDPVGGYGKLVDKLYVLYHDDLAVKNVKKVLYPKVRHEYLNDTSRHLAYAEIGDFCSSIKKRTND